MSEKNVLVLQGGGALGAYQAGAWSALHESGFTPDWLAGISIGAINAAIIAGNAPHERIAQLRKFWDLVSSGCFFPKLFNTQEGRTWQNHLHVSMSAALGVPGFFKPKNPWLEWQQMLTNQPILGCYDTSPLRNTLLDVIDFKRLNHPEGRVSLGAVQVTTGNLVYFDSAHTTLTPEHIMASGALPEGFPPVQIGDDYYWDGGLVSNTPLQYVIDRHDPTDDLCIFQIDLFNARGDMPSNLLEVMRRRDSIRYSSRTRFNTDVFRKNQEVRAIVGQLLDKIPKNALSNQQRQVIEKWANHGSTTIAHLIYRDKNSEQDFREYEFSREAINEHWIAGVLDVEYLLKQPAWKNRTCKPGIQVFDFNRQNQQTSNNCTSGEQTSSQ